MILYDCVKYIAIYYTLLRVHRSTTSFYGRRSDSNRGGNRREEATSKHEQDSHWITYSETKTLGIGQHQMAL